MDPTHTHTIARLFLRLLIALSLFSLSASAATLTVTDLSDQPAAPTAGTLRKAIADATPGDTIDFAPGLTGKITLGGAELLLDKDLTITGSGAGSLEISGNQQSRVFSIAVGATVNVSGVTVSHGQGQSSADGGGILNRGNLTVTACSFLSNTAGAGLAGVDSGPVHGPFPDLGSPGKNGGALANASGATLTVAGCYFESNLAGPGGLGGLQGSTNTGQRGGDGGAGGAIANFSSLANAVQISDTEFASNRAGRGGNTPGAIAGLLSTGGRGGALYSESGGLTITGSTFAYNSSGDGGSGAAGTVVGNTGSGGALALVGGTTNLTNCTLYANQASSTLFFAPHQPQVGGYGGGIYSTANLALTSCTFSYNGPGFGVQPGLGAAIYQSGSPASLRNTIISSGGQSGSFISLGHNLVPGSTGIAGFDGGQGDLIATPSFGTPFPGFGNHGGPTETLVLQPGSPGIDAGDDSLTGTDQRGYARLAGAHVDIGAVETVPTIIGFTVAQSTAEETVGVFHVQLTRSGDLTTNASITYTFLWGTTVLNAGNNDFDTNPGGLNFAPGESTKDLLVTIANDTEVEPDESFQIALAASPGVLLGPIANHAVTIHSDDLPLPGVIAFAQTSSTVSETAGTASLVIVRAGGTAAGATVQYATTAGTAVEGSDYTGTSGALTFGDGETQKSITIPITNDPLVENDETFTVTLSAPGGGASLGAFLTHTVTIHSDDVAPPSGVISLAPGPASLPEGTDVFGFMVVRTANITVEETVQYAATGGTATEGSDFTATHGTLTFAPFETQKFFSVPLLDDAVVEADETFTVTLSSPGGGATLGASTTQTVAIQNDDHVSLALARDVVTVREDAGVASVGIQLTGTSQLPVTVQFATGQYQSGGGIAVAGTDFQSVTTTLTFAPGETSKNVSVPILDNADRDGTRSFFVVLSSPSSGATLAPLFAGVVTITDDESQPSLTKTGYHGFARRTDAPGWGGLVVNTTAPGALTGTLQIENHVYRLAGTVTDHGKFTTTLRLVANRGPQYPLTLTFSGDNTALTGTFTGPSGASYDLTAERDLVGTSAAPVPPTGRYTAQLSADLGGPVRGYLAAEVLATGQVNLTGVLPDTTPFTQTSWVSNSGKVTIFKPLYAGGHGYLIGLAPMAPGSGVITFTSDLTWRKPKALRGLYPDGFADVPVQVAGARYVKRLNHPALNDFDATLGVGYVDFSGGELSASFTSTLRLLPTRAVVTLPNPTRTTLTVNPTTGVISGSFLHSDGHRRIFKGACVQLTGQDLAAGAFPGVTTAGTFELAAGSP